MRREGPLHAALSRLHTRILEGIKQRQHTPLLHPCPCRALDSTPATPVPSRITPVTPDEGDIDARATTLNKKGKFSLVMLKRSVSRALPYGGAGQRDDEAGGASVEASENMDVCGAEGEAGEGAVKEEPVGNGDTEMTDAGGEVKTEPGSTAGGDNMSAQEVSLQ